MSSFLFFDEYPDCTMPGTVRYRDLLCEHLSAGKASADISLYLRLRELDQAGEEKLLSSCAVPADTSDNLYKTVLERLTGSEAAADGSAGNSFCPESCRAYDSREALLRELTALLIPKGRQANFREWASPHINVLFEDLTATAMKTLRRFYEARADRSAYPSFDNWFYRAGYALLFSEYPILFRLLADGILSLHRNLCLLLRRVDTDRPLIARRFGIDSAVPIARVEANLSDRHNHGQTVSVIHFENGQALVCKPRSLAIDQFWYDLVSYLTKADPSLSLRAPLVLQREGYGYAEYIPFRCRLDESELPLFYRRCGVLLCLLSMLGGSDFHYENLIVSGPDPVLTDLETLITPWSCSRFVTGSDTSRYSSPSLRASRTLLLSKWVGGSVDGAVNIGALCSCGVQGKNRPLHADGSPVQVSAYADAVADGFAAMNALLRTHRSAIAKKLEGLKSVPVRFVLRNTRVYTQLLHYFTNLRGLTDGSTYECVTSRVYAPFLLSCDEDALRELLPAIRLEHDALKRRDIPLFYARGGSRDLVGPDGECLVRRFFEYSPEEIALRGLAAAEDETAAAAQLRYIRTSLALARLQEGGGMLENWSYQAVRRPVFSSGSPVPASGSLTAAPVSSPQFSAVSESGEQMIRHCFRMILENALDFDRMIFYAPKRDMNNGRYDLEIPGNSLYSGKYGIMLFLTMYAAFRHEPLLEQTLEIVLSSHLDELLARPKIMNLLDLSLTGGLAGLLLLLRNRSLITGKPVPQDTFTLLERLTPPRLEVWEETDYFNGLSGFLYALCSLSSLYGTDQFSELIRCAAGQILAKRSPQGWFQPAADYAPLTGLAHGQIGHALALSAAVPFLDGQLRESAQAAAAAAAAYEKNRIDEKAFNLPDYRKFRVPLRDAKPGEYVKRFMHGNCSGIIGSTAAILEICRLQETKQILQGIDFDREGWILTARRYLEAPELVGNDSLCCGTAAWLDLLVNLMADENHAAWAAAAFDRIARALLSNGPVLGILPDSIQDISLFKGLTGIGYVFLRRFGHSPSIVT